jgi:hypothetical protein
MNRKSQLTGAWCGPLFMLMLTIGWVLLGGYFPPHSPTATGIEMTSFYQSNPIRIRLGLLFSMWGTAALLPFSAVIAAQMVRIEGTFPVWSYTQLAAGAGTVLTLAFPFLFWAVAAFRPDRGADLILLLDDLAWIPFAAMTVPFLMIPICVAIVGFMDTSEHPVFPRWACYFNLWADFLILPGGLAIFFKTGPFAWNGLFGIYIPLITFGIWFGVMTFLLTRAINRQALAERTSADPL